VIDMPTYTVHEPPPRKGVRADPERFLFVRDGFYGWAFLLAPLWLLARRLWLAFVVYVIVSVAVDAGLAWVGLSGTAQVLAGLLIALIVGLEAGSLRRWKLERRGWQMIGFVVGDDLEDAERRFFAQWATRPRPSLPLPPAPPAAMPARREPPAGSEVIGLFPEPGGS
jgi:Protein of unknown function (DUF2628)